MYKYFIEYLEQKVELTKLDIGDKLIRASSYVVLILAIVLFLSFALLLVNIGISLWIGKALGNYGFGLLIVAGFYSILTVLVYRYRSAIKRKAANLIIKTFKNKKD